MTNETLKNPTVVTTPSVTGIDLAIKNLQTALASLPWLEKSFGRAWMLPINKGNEKVLEPHVYQGDGEYNSVMPNDALKSYSFWRVNGSRNLNEYEPLVNYGNFMLTDPVDVIFWFNMQAIDSTKNYIFKEELIKDVLNILSQDPNAFVLRIWDDKADDIFRGYTLSKSHRDSLMYPFGAFRIEMNLRYQFSCG